MRILIQNCKTGLYLTEDEAWCSDPTQARSFPSSGQAVSYCVRRECLDSQVVLKFEKDDLDVRLPLTQSCKHAALD